MKKRVVLVVSILALAVFTAGCGGNAASDEVVATGLPNLAEATTRGVNNEQRRLDAGELAPDFVLQFSDGKKARLSDWRGQPVVLNFWATWCAPCREEMPELVAAYERYRDEGLVIVGVNAQESAQQAARFVEQYKMSFPVALDSRGDVQQLYNIRGLPTTIFIDREGRIAERWAGLLTEALLEQQLAEIR